MRGKQTRARARRVLACALALLLVAGLVPALPEAPRALAEEAGAIALGDGAEDEVGVELGEPELADDAADGAVGLGDAGTAGADGDEGAAVVLDEAAEDALLDQLGLVAQQELASGGEDATQGEPEADGEPALEVQSASVSNPRVVKDSSMASGQVTTWDCVWFGSYPQTEVAPTDAAYASLQSASWDVNGDATVGGKRYRRISRDDATRYSYWSDDGYGSATWRYFRYEPIKWRVLEASGSRALVVSDVALDDQMYNANFTSVTWETSGIRSWLNGYGVASNEPGTDFTRKSFVGTAFSASERSAILATDVTNASNTEYGTAGGNDTKDKVFLLSEAEVYDASHGFANKYDTYDEARRCKPTDYARAMGAYKYTDGSYDGNCWWWLRSPGDFGPNCAAGVESSGHVYRDGSSVYYAYGAVRPALNLNLASSHPQAAGTVSSDGDVREPVNKAISSVSLEKANYTYDGTAKKPGVTVRAGDETVPALGYSVTYENNVNVGTATVTVTGKGDYTGTKSATFTITAKPISSCAVSLSPTSYTYDGKAKTPEVTVRDGSKALSEGTDYTVKYEDNVNVGTAKVTVTGKGNYTGTKVATFTIVEPQKKSISSCAVSLSPTSYAYDGSQKTPTITVKDGSAELTESTDYTVTWPDGRKNAGTYTVTVTGKGGYTGTKSATFTISPKALSSCAMALSPSSFTYDGTQKEPTIAVKDGSRTLTSGTDYTVTATPSGRTNVGTYTYKVTGKGNYTGTKSASFTILARSISSCIMSLSPTSCTYDGKAKTPEVTVRDGSKTLANGADYTVKYEDNVNAGPAKATVTGKGNYTGTKVASYTIAQAGPTLKFASATVTKKTTDAPFTNPLAKTTDGTVTFSSSNTKVATVDEAGKVTIKGGGRTTISASATAGRNYKAGSASFTLNVTKPVTYVISYDANGGTGTPSPQTKSKGVALKLSTAMPKKAYLLKYNANGGSVAPTSKSVGCSFVGWNTKRDGSGKPYSPGGSYTANAGATLYAQWKNGKAGALATPKRAGHDFAGWYTKAKGGKKVTASTVVAGNVTVYAHWADPYNMGDETYSFENYWDSDSDGHCFGMAMTSAGYHNGLLDIAKVGGSASKSLYSLDRTATVMRPICYYQGRQGSYSTKSTVAGGSYYLGRGYDIASDWQSVVNYVRNHSYDNTGMLQIGFRKDGQGGHAINFLRYDNVSGQDRIYAYDNNFPDRETYFYKDGYGRVMQAPVQTFSGSIDCIALRNVRTYFSSVKSFDATHVIYVAKDAATVQGFSYTYMEGSVGGSEYVMYEIPADRDKVTIIPKEDYADFLYMGTEYSFGEVTGETRGELRFATNDEGAAGSDASFAIYEAGPQTVTAANKTVGVGKTASIGAKTSGDGKLAYRSSDASVATVSEKGVVTGKKAGTAKITITAAATGKYAKATKTVTVTVKNANTMTAKVAKGTVTASLKALKGKAVKLAANVTVSKAKGAVSYANASSDATAKKFKVDAATGALTVPKGTKKGTYEVKVKVTAEGNKTCLKGTKTVTYKVQVK